MLLTKRGLLSDKAKRRYTMNELGPREIRSFKHVVRGRQVTIIRGGADTEAQGIQVSLRT